jgi:hypothetical protein
VERRRKKIIEKKMFFLSVEAIDILYKEKEPGLWKEERK